MKLPSVVLAALTLAPAWFALADAEGQRVVLDGVAFEVVQGGVRLTDGWGRGSQSDPFVLVEEFLYDGPAVLKVQNLQTRFGAPVAVGAGAGFVLEKVVTNSTDRPWLIFEMELREYRDLPSGYFDGLSFDQATDGPKRVGSDRFATIEVFDEPTDRIAFSGTVVEPGETVTVRVTITDHSPRSSFYLIQRRDAPLAALDRR